MRNLINAKAKEVKGEFKKFMLSLDECNTIEDLLKSWYFRNLIPSSSKNRKWNDARELKVYLIDRRTKADAKRLEEFKTRVNEVNNAMLKIESIDIKVDWNKSKTWGYNAISEVSINYSNFTRDILQGSRTSGCGYDKESTAISSALNQSKALLKLMYTEKNRPSRINKKNSDIFGYGSGYGLTPHFEGGTGVSCYYSIFKKLGFKFEQVTHGKLYDVYKAVRTKK